MDEWVMKIDSIGDLNELRNVKDYIHYKLRMEVRKETSDNAIRLKEQELEALKNKQKSELGRKWTPNHEYRGSSIADSYSPTIGMEQAKHIRDVLLKEGGDEGSNTDVTRAAKKVMGDKS